MKFLNFLIAEPALYSFVIMFCLFIVEIFQLFFVNSRNISIFVSSNEGSL